MEENKGSSIISIIFWGNDTMTSILELLLLCDVITRRQSYHQYRWTIQNDKSED